MIDEDRFIIETIDNWEYGADNSGNIMKRVNILRFWERARKFPGASATSPRTVNMVTSDGSIDCNFDPNRQESITAHLHYCETVCALGLLAEGGSFVLKMFTLFEHSTVCIVYLLATLFNSVEVFKPSCSKEGNSETYIICVGYRGISDTLLRELLKYVEGEDPFVNHAMFSKENIPENFLREYIKCAKFFKVEQQEIIEHNLSTEGKLSYQDRSVLIEAKNKFSREWVKKTDVQPLRNKSQRIVERTLIGFGGNFSSQSTSQEYKKNAGTLQDRQKDYQNKQNSRKMVMDLQTGESGKEKAEQKNSEEIPSDVSRGPPKKRLKLEAGREAIFDNDKKEETKTQKDDMEVEENEGQDEEPAKERFGLRMMKKFNYQEGTGLGRNRDGIVGTFITN